VISKVTMPKLGQTMEKGVIEKWIKKEGDEVKKGDILLEITTDKATLEVESYVSGTLLKIVAKEGEEVPVNGIIAVVGDPGEEIPEEFLKPTAVTEPEKKAEEKPAAVEQKPAPAEAPSPAPVAAPPAPRGRIFASPRARKLAERELVPLRCLRGSGPNGRIVEADVKAYLKEIEGLRVSPAARRLAYERGVDLRTVQPSGERIMKEDVLKATPVAAVGKPIELSAMRRIIAERLSQSKREIPHFYLVIRVDMTDAIAWRKESMEKAGIRISYNDMLMKACAIALREVPRMNCSWEGSAILLREEVNIGLAVALDDGLIVPVVRDVDRKSITDIARESAELIEKARGKRLTPDEYGGGSLTISNLGMFGVDLFVPIINPGEPAIIGVGRIQETPVAKDGGIFVRSMMTLSLSGDHRALDGATAAKFLQIVKEVMEQPERLE